MSTTVGIVSVPLGGVNWKLDCYYPTKDTHFYGFQGSISQTALMDVWPPSTIDVYISVVVYDSLGYVVYQAYKLGPFTMQNYQIYNWDCNLNTLRGAANFAAQIFAKQLKYDTTTVGIPAPNTIPQNSSGKIYLTAKNLSTVSAKLGINWNVKNPNGVVVQTFSSESGYVNPAAQYLFVGDAFTFNQVGTWTVDFTLYIWDGNEWLEADTWSGTLCVVSGSAPVDAPVLVSPANGANVGGTSITFKWNAVTGATDYQLYIAKGGVVFYNQAVGNVVQKVVTGFADDGSGYTWKVAAKNAYGTGPWSNVWSFTNGTPQPVFSDFSIVYSKL